MFDLFGELNSAEDMNQLAGNLLKEGDIDSIRRLAGENGIDTEIAQAFIDGEIPFLVDEMTAAIGKLDIEAEELKPKEIMEDWVQYIKSQCMDDSDMAAAVRKEGKSLKGCIAELLKWSYKNMYDIPDEVIKAAGISSAKVKLGIPGMGTAREIIRKYYLGGKRS